MIWARQAMAAMVNESFRPRFEPGKFCRAQR
jgi:hypothetical protein